MEREIKSTRKENVELKTSLQEKQKLILDLKQQLNDAQVKGNPLDKRRRRRNAGAPKFFQDSHLDTWLTENLVAKAGIKIHVHRFDKTYFASQGLPAPATNSTSTSMFVEKLTKLGYKVPSGGDKTRDSACCTGTTRYVIGADVKNWTSIT
jgi:hypothetical protein